MPQLLLELFSEEIPARMQADAARDLERMAQRAAARRRGFAPERLRAFAGPRRLTLVVDGLPAAQGDRSEERKGPRVGAPDAALDGFLRSTGLSREQLVERDGAWFATIAHAGRPTAEIIAEMVQDIVRGFPWPKSMTWGTGPLRWVRPLQRILCVFDGEIVPLQHRGHRGRRPDRGPPVHGLERSRSAPATSTTTREALAGHFVVLDADERKARILDGAQRALRATTNLELVEDEGLLDEVAGLAEWPVAAAGRDGPGLPRAAARGDPHLHAHAPEAISRCGPARRASSRPHFVVVANIEADRRRQRCRGRAMRGCSRRA